MERKYAPFSQEEIEALKKFQENPMPHGFTCCSPSEIEECLRRLKPNAEGEYISKNEGELIPREEGWICPCGKYTQDWCYEFMLHPLPSMPWEKNEVIDSWAVRSPGINRLLGLQEEDNDEDI